MFCYWCGLKGHSTSKCEHEPADKTNVVYQYGNWIRVQMVQQFQGVG